MFRTQKEWEIFLEERNRISFQEIQQIVEQLRPGWRVEKKGTSKYSTIYIYDLKGHVRAKSRKGIIVIREFMDLIKKPAAKPTKTEDPLRFVRQAKSQLENRIVAGLEEFSKTTGYSPSAVEISYDEEKGKWNVNARIFLEI